MMKGKHVFLFLLSATLSCSYLPLDMNIPANVTVRDTRFYVEIRPKDEAPRSTGFMFYPGALVDPHAYNAMMARLAAQKILAVVVKAPANLAVINPDAGVPLMTQFPGITRWVIGGHSLGGAMACTLIKSKPDLVSGLILFAAYPADSDSLAGWNKPVLSLSASQDGLATPVKITNSVSLLPPGKWIGSGDRVYPSLAGGYSVFHQVAGGCHAYFGNYGPQDGDGTPLVTRDAQQDETADYILEFFVTNGWGN